MAYRGSCLCGAVTYTSGAEAAVFEGNCYCRDCHKESGTGHITAVAVPDATFTLNGEVNIYNKPTDSGGILAVYFCPICATTLFTRPSNAPGLTLMRAGTLDDAPEIAPNINLYAPRAPAWDPASPAIQGVDAMPPRP